MGQFYKFLTILLEYCGVCDLDYRKFAIVLGLKKVPIPLLSGFFYSNKNPVIPIFEEIKFI